MERRQLRSICLFVLLSCFALTAVAQERVAPLGFNGAVLHKTEQLKHGPQLKTTALGLPFFEDFTGYDSWPDPTKWKDVCVYINNTMGMHPVSRGMATFDGLDAGGLPYNQSVSTALVYADSLTSQFINTSMPQNNISDSIYFSFFYQAQGNGFGPEIQDSLMLFFKKSNGAWIKVWAKEGGTPDTLFTQVMVPLVDTNYLHDTFQFRFVNKASLNTNDDVWNVDYIKLAKGRNMNDTFISDVAMTNNPSNLLNDLTAMPYRQFIADPGKELATQLTATIRNGYSSPQTVTYGYTAKERYTGTPLATSGTNSTTIVSNGEQDMTTGSYTNTVPSSQLYDNFIFDTKHYIQSLSVSDNSVNDTILQQQVFYNYMAYDDGTAEKAYYLNLFPTLPGKTAIEYHLNQPDTVSGVSIYFGRQVPLAYSKYFSVAVYKDISFTGGTDNVAYQEDFLIPAYMRNDFFWTYKFEHPVAMPAGTFYIGTVQPALSNSDSLYLGLDVNRVTGNHAYYNVVGYWQPSTISGAIMVRPILGPIIASDVPKVEKAEIKWFASPDPVHDRMRMQIESDEEAQYTLTDMQGRAVLQGDVKDGQYLDVNDLSPGVYLMRLSIGKMQMQPQKILKY